MFAVLRRHNFKRNPRLSSNRAIHNETIDLEQQLIFYARKKQTPVSLRSLMETGKGDLLTNFESTTTSDQPPTASELVLFQVASFLHRELPVRIAHRVAHLHSNPLLLSSRKFYFGFDGFESDVFCLFCHVCSGDSEHPESLRPLQAYI